MRRNIKTQTKQLSFEQPDIQPINISDFTAVIDDIEGTTITSPWKWKPPSFHEFIHGKEFVNKPNLYPAIQEDGEIVFSGPDYTPICEVFLDDEGLGSGKSTKAAVFSAYIVTWLFHLKNIEQYFNLEGGISKLAIYNMAPSAKNAKDVLFSKFQTLLENIKWFRDNSITIDPRVTSQIVFQNQPLAILPGNSSRSFAVGYDTFICCIDECAADDGFDTKDKDYFQDLFDSANERRRSRFVDCPMKGLMLCTSSAGTENRYFEKLITEIEEIYEGSGKNHMTDPVDHDIGRVMYRRRSAFEANPKHRVYLDAGDYFEHTVIRQPRPNKKIEYHVRIPNKFRGRFNTNPAKLLRNMCAIPSLALSPFFTEWERVLECINLSQRRDPYPNKVDDYGYLIEVDPPSVWRDLPDNFHGIQGILYYLHVDLALSGDGCGIAMGHRGAQHDREGSSFPTVYVDLSLCFQGSEANRIKIAEVKQFVIDLTKKRGFRFAKVTFDNFQSAQTIQELQDMGFTVEKKGVKKSDFEVLMELIYDKRLDWYYDEWALGEAKRLEDKGTVVEKSVGSTDDEIECLARVCAEALEGHIPDSFVRPRALGFSSKGAMPSRPPSQPGSFEMGLKNPQTDKKFVKPAYGFSAGFKGKPGSRR